MACRCKKIVAGEASCPAGQRGRWRGRSRRGSSRGRAPARAGGLGGCLGYLASVRILRTFLSQAKGKGLAAERAGVGSSPVTPACPVELWTGPQRVLSWVQYVVVTPHHQT